MKNNKELVEYQENIFYKIKKFFKKIFNKEDVEKYETIQEVNMEKHEKNYISNTRKQFNEYISFKENKEELDMINSIRENPEKLKKMSMEELKEVENAIRNRQNFVDKKIAKLKTDLAMKKA